ncbi:MAG: Carboxypeptidase G2 [Chlamydiae bacterium]|nr:Carboxypeptidase G2 [Chlamydiota bacterium]
MDQYFPHIQGIDKQKEAMTSLLMHLANIHSGSDNLPGLEEMLSALKEAFSSLGGKQETLALKSYKCLTPNGNLIETPLGKALSITKNRGAPINILLCGHMDIAFPANLPLEKCKRIGNGKLAGRGTCDMKGGLVVMLTALQALENSPFAEKIGWQVLINPDEEIGSPGSRELFLHAVENKKLGLLFEPSLPDGSLVSARKGSTNYSVAIRGKAAHAGRDFHLGSNAITSAARFTLAAESLTDQKNGVTVNVGHIEGGGPVNIVPDRAFCRLNIRVKNDRDLKIIKEKLKTIANIENNREGITLILHQDSERPPKVFDKKTKLLFEALKTCAENLGYSLEWEPTGGVCDGNTLAGAGLPVIDTLGVVGGHIHSAQEYVVLSSLVDRAKLVTRFLMQIAAKEVNV